MNSSSSFKPSEPRAPKSPKNKIIIGIVAAILIYILQLIGIPIPTL